MTHRPLDAPLGHPGLDAHRPAREPARRLGRLAWTLLLGALLAGCAGPDRVLDQAAVDVDTPQLRELKATTAVPDCVSSDAAPVAGGLPELTLPCLGGGSDVQLSSLRGPLVVNLWAAWCGPCRRELGIYESFHQRFGDRVAVLGVDYQDPQPQGALELAKAKEVSYPLLADPESRLNGADGIGVLRGLPAVVFVAADGRIARTERVAIADLDELVDLAEQHLGVRLR